MSLLILVISAFRNHIALNCPYTTRYYKDKSIVFGLLEHVGMVYTMVVEGVFALELMEIIRKKTRKENLFKLFINVLFWLRFPLII